MSEETKERTNNFVFAGATKQCMCNICEFIDYDFEVEPCDTCIWNDEEERK